MPGEAAALLELQCRLLCSRDASMLQLCNSLPAEGAALVVAACTDTAG